MKHLKEHAIGERFVVDHIIYEVRPTDTYSCEGCSLLCREEAECLDYNRKFGACGSCTRTDGQDVIFVQVGEDDAD